VQGPMEAFTSAIAQGASAMDALKAAGTSALNAIAKQLADMAAQNLWKAAFGGATSGGAGGIFGSLFGGGSNPIAAGGVVGLLGIFIKLLENAPASKWYHMKEGVLLLGTRFPAIGNSNLIAVLMFVLLAGSLFYFARKPIAKE